MERTMFERLSGFGRRAAGAGALLALVLAAGATAVGDVSDEAKREGRDRARNQSLGLFAGPSAVLRGNLLQCGLRNTGDVCADVFNSPTGGGGFWPTGSVDQYIFNSGLQIAGINTADAGPWAGDTVAAYFFDARGTQPHGTALTDIFDSQNPEDLANWPAEAVVSDPDLFQPVLLGRNAASQQDSWTQYWDGDPSRNAERKHPMGIQVTQRSLAWNFPTGNESIIYFIYRFQNVTNDAEFQRLNETAFFAGADALPDEGWTIGNIFAAFSMDPDVTPNALENFSTAILPFSLGIAYHGGFSAPSFVFPPQLFHPPFFTSAPGIVGVKYLQSPIDPETGEQIGLVLFSNTLNADDGFPDPVGDEQLFRYLSGTVDPALGDNPCNVQPSAPGQRPLCFLFQTAADTRFYQSSGPFALDAGQEAVIVVAYMVAATVQTLPDGSGSGIVANSSDPNANPPGVPSFHPGCESVRGTTTQSATQNAVRSIEVGAGWIPDNPDGTTSNALCALAGDALEVTANRLPQDSVDVIPESLLGKALLAQTIFDNKFLLGFAPEPPAFQLLPGDNQVTVIWNPSATEAQGDPFFEVASDPASALFNPNYREFDVEGYRVFRGTTPAQLSLVAQFDFANTTFTDFTCETVPTDENVGVTFNGVEVPGYAGGEDCPIDPTAPLVRNIDNDLVFNNGGAGGAPGAGVVRTSAGTPVALSVTAAVDEPDDPDEDLLQDTGVGYVFVDNGVTNNFTFFYAVTAFDVNSEASGPASLESAEVPSSVVPRANAPNLEATFSSTQQLLGADGTPLVMQDDPVQPDGETGIFPGPQPPTDNLILGFNPDPSLVGSLVATGGITGQIDSVVPHAVADGECPQGAGLLGTCWELFLTVGGSPQVAAGFTPVWAGFGDPTVTSTLLAAETLPFSTAELAKFGVPAGFGEGVAATVTGEFPQTIWYSAFEGQATQRIGDGAENIPGGSRWFDGEQGTTPDPARFVRVGHLEGIDTIWAPIFGTPTGVGEGEYAASSPMQCFGYTLSFLSRAADTRFTWGEGGTFSEVTDVTHQVPVSFREQPAATWGFLNTDANGNGVLDWKDFDYLDVVNEATQSGVLTFCETDPSVAKVALENAAVIQPTSTQGVLPASVTQTGVGFGLYVNGERYIFETSTLPAAGTVWTLRTYAGIMGIDDGSAQTNDPTGYFLSNANFGGDFPETALERPPLIPGLRFALEVTEAGTQLAGQPDLSDVHTVPDPYLATGAYDLSPTTKELMFVNLPARATIRIYSLSGVLVKVLNHNDAAGGGRQGWDLRNRNNQFVASGVYFFHVVTPSGDEHVGKFTIVNFASSN